LFAMGKVTSDDFLYGRKHSRISKCPKTRSKVRSKSGSKTRPGQHLQPRKRPYTGKSSCKWGQKRYSKTSPKTTAKKEGKKSAQNGAKNPLEIPQMDHGSPPNGPRISPKWTTVLPRYSHGSAPVLPRFCPGTPTVLPRYSHGSAPVLQPLPQFYLFLNFPVARSLITSSSILFVLKFQ
jgi:hypothetical protein